LILSTGHAPSAAQSVDRIVDLFPPHERASASARLSSVLLGIFTQALVPHITSGRIAAVEIMIANAPVKNLIREGKTHLLANTIRTHSQQGMCTLDMALVELYKARSITWDTALAYSQDPAELEKIAGEAGIPI
jgi:twitching motility protein PilT